MSNEMRVFWFRPTSSQVENPERAEDKTPELFREWFEAHSGKPVMYKNPEEKRIAEAEQAAEQQYIDNLTVFDSLKFAQACLWEKAETYEELAKKYERISVFKNCLGEVTQATRIIDRLIIRELVKSEERSEESPCSNYDPRMCNAPCDCAGCRIQRDNDLTKENNTVKV